MDIKNFLDIDQELKNQYPFTSGSNYGSACHELARIKSQSSATS